MHEGGTPGRKGGGVGATPVCRLVSGRPRASPTPSRMPAQTPVHPAPTHGANSRRFRSVRPRPQTAPRPASNPSHRAAPHLALHTAPADTPTSPPHPHPWPPLDHPDPGRPRGRALRGRAVGSGADQPRARGAQDVVHYLQVRARGVLVPACGAAAVRRPGGRVRDARGQAVPVQVRRAGRSGWTHPSRQAQAARRLRTLLSSPLVVRIVPIADVGWCWAAGVHICAPNSRACCRRSHGLCPHLVCST